MVTQHCNWPLVGSTGLMAITHWSTRHFKRNGCIGRSTTGPYLLQARGRCLLLLLLYVLLCSSCLGQGGGLQGGDRDFQLSWLVEEGGDGWGLHQA